MYFQDCFMVLLSVSVSMVFFVFTATNSCTGIQFKGSGQPLAKNSKYVTDGTEHSQIAKRGTI